MILYNVTVNIDIEVEQEWIEWMKSTHIPDVMATGLFTENKFFRLLHEVEEGGVNYSVEVEEGGVNYSVQYFAEDMDKIQAYQANHAAALQAEVKKKYDGRYAVFRSLLESVD